MAGYDQIDVRLKAGSLGAGVQKGSQKARKKTGLKTYGSTTPSLESSSGICAALVIRWLKAKKQGSNFWTSQLNDSSGLLPKDYKFFSETYSEHRALSKSKALIGKDQTYAEKMRGIATYSRTDAHASGADKNAAAIATTVLTDTGRYFILSLARNGGAHAVGFHRVNGFFGKKNWAYFYDPNKGEFWVKKLGIATILSYYSKYDTAYALRVFV